MQRDSKTEYNLQAADIIAGTVYKAYNQQQPHFLNLIQGRVLDASEFPAAHFKGSLLKR